MKKTSGSCPETMIVLAITIVMAIVSYLIHLLHSEPTIKVSDYIQLLILAVIAGTLFISWRNQYKKDQLYESEIYLQKTISLIEKAYNVIKNDDGFPSNDRIAWVTSARLITRALNLSSKIILESHKEIFISEHDYYRHMFSDLLKIDGEPLPASFFCGSTHISTSLGEAAFNSSSTKNVGDNWIPTRIVSEIYRFKSYPNNYSDPLNNSMDLSREEREKLSFTDEDGVSDYFIFRDNFIPIIDKVYPRGDKTAVTKEAIDTKMELLSERHS